MNSRKILVVDDNPVVVKALTMQLESDGFQVLSAEDGSSAVQIARREAPDAILLDLNFPAEIGMSWDGFAIMNWLMQAIPVPGKGKPTPIIIITAEGSKNRERCLRMGASAFFQKPVDHNELLKALKKCLELETPEPVES